MTTQQTPGALVREIRLYLGANVHLCGVEDSMLDDAALDLARLVLGITSQPAESAEPAGYPYQIADRRCNPDGSPKHTVSQLESDPFLAASVMRNSAAHIAADGIWERLKSPLTPYGSLVRALRGVAGTSLMEMSEATDYSPAHLSAVEFGRSDVTRELISATRRFFNDKGLSVSALILQQAADARRIEGESNA